MMKLIEKGSELMGSKMMKTIERDQNERS